MSALKDQVFPENYSVSFNIYSLIPQFDIKEFMKLLSDKCAAFIVEYTNNNYQVIFNTYNFMQRQEKMAMVDIFRYSIEQKKRSSISNDWTLILNKKPIFMAIYMYSHNGFRIGAALKRDGTYEFGAYGSQAFIDTINEVHHKKDD